MNPKVLWMDHAGVLGGAELCLLDIARCYDGPSAVLLFADGPFRGALKRAGVEVEVVAAPGAVSGIRRESGAARNLGALPGVLGLAVKTARLARGYDVVYANSQKALVIGALAAKLAGRPLVWHLHDVMTAEHFSGVNRRVAVALANGPLVRRVVANSEASARAFVESGGKAEKVRVVYNGIDPAPYSPPEGPEEKRRTRENLGLPLGAPVVGAFSRLAPWKGQHVLLKALARLPGVHALVVGEALFGEEDYARELRGLASSLGVAERTHFLGFREDVARLMRASDVVVHASTAPEPFGRMIVEGMLASRPVVATMAGGALEIVEHGANGLLVEPGDAEDLAGTLRTLFAEPPLGRALAERGRATAVQRFSLGAMTEGVRRQVTEVVGGNPPGKRRW